MSTANVTPRLDKEKIRALIPHAGAMVLLDNVRQWNSDFIECDSRTHLDPSNPLRCGPHLSPVAGIEYAAQAVAVHGALCTVANNGVARIGYLAVLSDISWHVDRIDGGTEALIVRATKLATLSFATEYSFSLMLGNSLVLEGRCMISLGPEADIPTQM